MPDRRPWHRLELPGAVIDVVEVAAHGGGCDAAGARDRFSGLHATAHWTGVDKGGLPGGSDALGDRLRLGVSLRGKLKRLAAAKALRLDAFDMAVTDQQDLHSATPCAARQSVSNIILTASSLANDCVPRKARPMQRSDVRRQARGARGGGDSQKNTGRPRAAGLASGKARRLRVSRGNQPVPARALRPRSWVAPAIAALLPPDLRTEASVIRCARRETRARHGAQPTSPC